jgi:integrase
MRLTQAFVDRVAIPPGKAEHFEWDDDVPQFGIRLRLREGRQPGVSKVWYFKYRIGLKQRSMPGGSVSAIRAAAARDWAQKLYAKVLLGEDPAGQKSELKARAGETFEAAMRLFLARQKARLRPRSYVSVERHLLVFAKALHRLPLAGVDRRAIATQLTQAAAATSDATANRVRASLSAFYVWAMKQGLCESNPVALTERREETSRDRVLNDVELREIWLALREDPYGDIVRLLILLGSRRDELGALKWSEVDLDRALISLSAERTKNKRAHEIPLSAPALAILRAQPLHVLPHGTTRDRIFGAGQIGFSDWSGSKIDLDKRILATRVAAAENASTDAAEIVPMLDWTLHDFRRVISTAMHDQLGIPPHVVEAVLGHVGHQAGTPGRYNRSNYSAAKRQALDMWGAHVEALVAGETGANIVPLATRHG